MVLVPEMLAYIAEISVLKLCVKTKPKEESLELIRDEIIREFWAFNN
jgi:hypothetical protein